MREAGPVGTDAASGQVRALVEGLGAETGLLRELRASLIEQREALGRDDTTALEDVVHQIGRTLMSLREARRERGRLIEFVAGGADVPLTGLASRMPDADVPGFQSACRELHHAAVGANSELVINQAVLRRAIESGEHYLQRILTVPATLEGSVGYAESASVPAAGLLLNQRA